MSEDNDNDNDNDNVDYYALLEEYGRAHLEDMRREDPDNPELAAVLDETDTSCSNEDLGLDKDGNRDDDP